MVTDSEAYMLIIEYLTENLNVFENSGTAENNKHSVREVIELELSEQIISVCSQNDKLSFNQRNDIIREVDAVLYDLEEVLSGVLNNPATDQQTEFIKEFATLIKNIFDDVINQTLNQ